MVLFGPSGNDEKFYADGNQSSVDAPRWLAGMGLTAYEISFGRGIRMTDKTAQVIGAQASAHGIRISVHAPYYINLANAANLEKNYHYIKRSLELLQLMGGDRLVVHTGCQMQMTRAEALQNCRDSLQIILQRLHEDGIENYWLCLETMGKYTQIGNLDEICDLCALDPKHLMPTVDLGHMNCLAQGQLDLPRVFEQIKVFPQVHFHISFIEYNLKGEIRHVTLADEKYGFDLQLVMQLLRARPGHDVVISESDRIMAQDSLRLRDFYLQKNVEV
ncbi:MAG: TIM barrel protein [Eubacteriales bacterium]|nr:TIM barrel protein [Eubacteriales bacterium]